MKAVEGNMGELAMSGDQLIPFSVILATGCLTVLLLSALYVVKKESNKR